MSLERLWAGWRSSYIDGSAAASRPDGCLFCGLPTLADGEALILGRDAECYTVMNAYPYTSGHVMVVPDRHVGSITELDAPEAAALMQGVQHATALIEAVYAPHGLNVGINIGRAGGAGIPGHVHVHVVPRWDGDTNFMTSVAESRVLPEGLGQSYDKLRAAWSAP